MNQEYIQGSAAPARKPELVVIGATAQPKTQKLRVAAYARVSSDSSDQLNSFAAQVRAYTELIEKHADWELVDLYADEGITGTRADKRDEFQRLLRDCRRGRIDRILTKSTSRFARNAVDCLKTVRELKSLGVSIKFEKENIDTGLMSNELMLAFFSGAAQEESVSIAKNKRLGNRMQMKNGTYVASSVPFGYRLVENALEVDEKQAAVVRRIFQNYLDGMNLTEIADALTAEGVTKKNGETIWLMSAVAYILKNERYIGDVLFQKTYATETLPFQQVRNKGELNRYYWQGTHAPIISRETWDRAQALLAQRGEQFINPQAGVEYPLSKKMTCGHCGGSLRRKDRGSEVYWVCRNHDANRDACPVMQIPESEIYRAFLCLYYKLRSNYRKILSPMAEQLQTLRLRQDMENLALRELAGQIQQLTKQSQMLHSLRAKGIFDSALFITKSNELNHQLQELTIAKARLLDRDEDTTVTKALELIQLLERGPELLDEFDPELFADIVEGVIVESNERLHFQLHCGLELPETIERTVRG